MSGRTDVFDDILFNKLVQGGTKGRTDGGKGSARYLGGVARTDRRAAAAH